mgnify:CR=1 FL=1|jgi:hypothetical protein
MKQWYRLLLGIVSGVQAILGIGFALQVPVLTSIWVFPNTTPLSFMFIGSIFAAAAASTLWCVLTGTEGALVGIGLDYSVILLPLGILSLQIANGNSALLIFAVLCFLGVLFGGYMIYRGTRNPIRDRQPTPVLVRGAFAFFIIALIIVGGSMVLKVPDIMPWTISEDQSVVYGWMFLGAAVYFIYALVRPVWHNAAGQLAGFLAYDLVLILPFLNRFTTPIPEQFILGHIIYTAVVTFSGLLAAYYLFVNPRTRILTAFAG